MLVEPVGSMPILSVLSRFVLSCLMNTLTNGRQQFVSIGNNEGDSFAKLSPSLWTILFGITRVDELRRQQLLRQQLRAAQRIVKIKAESEVVGFTHKEQRYCQTHVTRRRSA